MVVVEPGWVVVEPGWVVVEPGGVGLAGAPRCLFLSTGLKVDVGRLNLAEPLRCKGFWEGLAVGA